MSNDHVHPIFQTLVDIARPVVLCENCEERPAVDADLLCQECLDNAAEAAHERRMEAFYGGGEPVTMDELHSAAWEEKRWLR